MPPMGRLPNCRAPSKGNRADEAGVPPETIRLLRAPSPETCSAAGLLLQNVGPFKVMMKIRWEVYQP
jgi:hypothetical protein